MRPSRRPVNAFRLFLLASVSLAFAGPAISGAAYTYDALGRVILVRFDDGKQVSYTYDPAGNRTQHVVSATSGNRPPVAVADSVTMGEDQTSVTLNPITNDTDPDANSLSLFSSGNGTLGTSALSGGGTTVTYSSTNKKNSTDTFFYVIGDGSGLQATGEVTVTFSNLAPVAVSDSVSTTKNNPKSFDPRTNDTDPGNDPLTIVAVTAPLHGTATVMGGGTSVYYTPTANYYGSDSLTYTINDIDGGASTATISMTVAYGSQAPVAVADSKSTNVGVASTFDPRTNDTDPDGSALTITAKTNGTKGSVVINSGTSVTYTPNAGASGADSFTYTIADVDGQTATATVSMTIQAANSPPVAVNDTVELYGTYGPGNTNGTSPTGTIDPRWNDTDPDGNTLTITNVTQPTNGTATINGGGTSVTITRTAVCPGVSPTIGTVTYTISDGLGGTATGTITSTKLCESNN